MPVRFQARDEHLGFVVDDGGEVKSVQFCGSKRMGRVGKARSTRGNTNPRVKSNKTSTHQQITKKIGAIFVGNFQNRTKNNKIKLEHKERDPKS